MNDFNHRVIEEFRANKGNVGGMWEGGPLLLLSTTGARSGRQRTNPLAYTRDGDRFVIIASKGGAPTNPDWYYNLRASPEATIEVGGETLRVRARFTEGQERERLFAAMVEEMPGFAEYQAKTTRTIPVVVLEPLDSARG